ncbi:MAG: triose-phosphate isomerase [Clostridiales bacterium]|nr:triose-phosphate isomerase [Candidatus Apopatocola equi]
MNKKYRRVYIAGNWKMNMLPSRTKTFVEELKRMMPPVKHCCTAVLCMPATHLSAMGSPRFRRVSAGAQNVSEFDMGAHTGEVSAEMLKDAGAQYCIIGHSERRQYNGETDEQVHEKLLKLLENGITPILCVGETAEQRRRGLTMEHIAYQLKAAIHGLSDEQIRSVVIAYEPVWAIGTGVTATAAQAQEVCFNLRELLRRDYGALVSRKVSILYGGSMNAGNCAELLAQNDIDGGLIGGASLTAADFAAIITEGCKE